MGHSDPSAELAARRAEVDHVMARLVEWTSTNPGVRALGLVGSWVHDRAGLDSDLDVLLLTDDPDRYAGSDEWLRGLDMAPVIRRGQWGLVTERRVQRETGLQIEFAIAPLAWASTKPVDAGTRRVVNNGLRILYDPDNRLATLREALDQEARVTQRTP